jgi:hypothetical protein
LTFQNNFNICKEIKKQGKIYEIKTEGRQKKYDVAIKMETVM